MLRFGDCCWGVIMADVRFPKGLYGVTPEWSDTGALCDAIRQAHAGGMVALQWRRKFGDRLDLVKQAEVVGDLCKSLGLVFIINDDWRLALDLDADGVHLGKDDGLIAPARSALGADKYIGRSCYNRIDLAAKALADGVDYIAFGAVYPSSVKPDAPHASLELIKESRDLLAGVTPRPAIITIGGITVDNTAALLSAGADGVAVISSLFESSDIRQTAADFTNLFLL